MILLGNSEEVLKTLPDNSVDSIVTDPPYGLSFMGKKWDYDVPSTELWAECLRVLKPGGYLLAFAGTRTQHRMAVRIEDAGFEIRDMIAWVYGSGFPKSLNIGKAVDANNKYGKSHSRQLKQIEQEEGGASYKLKGKNNGILGETKVFDRKEYTAKNDWDGWGTALKPALEPITVARKPISEKNIAENVLKWGTGGINIDATRVGTETLTYEKVSSMGKTGEFSGQGATRENGGLVVTGKQTVTGRFPANLIHDGSDEVVGLFPETKSGGGIKLTGKGSTNNVKFQNNSIVGESWKPDSGSAARFFYCAKASKSERNKGLEEFEVKTVNDGRDTPIDNAFQRGETPRANVHPTVKPIALMRYLVKMVTPVGGTVLDPFNGSGTTGIAAKLENFDYIGIEREEEYVKISEARIAAWQEPQGALL